ncbi:MAG: barnase inhibitor [Deltaproteobacteria bacterium HGW-Deltaproteobacteria-13]|nr:MAG: barnase inhibitor [Deltaproteobacteria bacterium HGW-Deltaproteobacteria-13]
MQIKRCTLNGKAIRSLDDLYDQLAVGLSLPKYFGRNLDALWDVLATDVEGPFEIVWNHADKSRKVLGDDFDQVLELFQELEKERDDFELKIEK